ncbi:MAG TPA: hypothetical protein DCY88_15665 [Cyanobacteria bacterium UBA11372]|nr:hypothetical protein [Cyanobacteria bacterium UBA11372]
MGQNRTEAKKPGFYEKSLTKETRDLPRNPVSDLVELTRDRIFIGTDPKKPGFWDRPGSALLIDDPSGQQDR